jgi:hypothetical protein
MTRTTIEILGLGISLAALLGTVIVVDWPTICDWWEARKLRYEARRYPPVGEAPLTLAEFMRRIEIPPEAKHPTHGIPYNITRHTYCPQEDRDGE